MNSRARSLHAWRSVCQRLGANGSVTISKASHFPHPRDAGARASVSWPVGQLADYALELEQGLAPLLIREFGNRFEVAVAGVELTERAMALAKTNPIAALYLGGTLLGASLGAAVTRRNDGALAGAAIGALSALVVHLVLRDRQKATGT